MNTIQRANAEIKAIEKLQLRFATRIQELRAVVRNQSCVYAGPDQCNRAAVTDGVCEVHRDLKKWQTDIWNIRGVQCNVTQKNDGRIWVETEADMTLMPHIPTVQQLKSRGFERVIYADRSLAAGFHAATWRDAYNLMHWRVYDFIHLLTHCVENSVDV